MSIVMSVRVGDGLVMAADSASTLQALDQQRRVRGVAKIFNNATKILQLRDYPVGVASWGAGTIGARSISSLVYEHAVAGRGLEEWTRYLQPSPSRHRHELTSQWLKNGVDVRTVQELLGHSDIHTTMRYVHYLQEHAVESVREAEKREISGGRKVDGES